MLKVQNQILICSAALLIQQKIQQFCLFINIMFIYLFLLLLYLAKK